VLYKVFVSEGHQGSTAVFIPILLHAQPSKTSRHDHAILRSDVNVHVLSATPPCLQCQQARPAPGGKLAETGAQSQSRRPHSGTPLAQRLDWSLLFPRLLKRAGCMQGCPQQLTTASNSLRCLPPLPRPRLRSPCAPHGCMRAALGRASAQRLAPAMSLRCTGASRSAKGADTTSAPPSCSSASWRRTLKTCSGVCTLPPPPCPQRAVLHTT
jgi:hypothetical protein